MSWIGARIALVMSLATAIAAGAGAAPAPVGDTAYRFLLAQTLAQEGSYREALDLFEELARDQPGEAYVRIEYAELLLRLGRLRRAAQEAGAAHELAPDDPEALRLYGQVNLRLAEEEPEALDRARLAFEELRKSNPDDLEPMVTLGQIYLSQNRSGEAADLFAELLAVRPADRMFLSFLLEALQRSGRIDRAEEALRSFLVVDPGFLRARLALAEILSDRGDHLSAIATLEDGVAEDEPDPELLRQLAVELYRSGDSGRALDRVEQVLKSRPDDFGARYLRALTLVDFGLLEEAERQLRRLVEDHPENLDIAVLLSRVLEHEDRAEDAVAVLEAAVGRLDAAESEAPTREARLRLAEIAARAGDWERVRELTGELLAGGEVERRVDIVLLEAEALAQLGQPERALESLRGLSSGLEPAPPRVVAKRAEILLGIDRAEEARSLLDPLTSSRDLDSLLLAADVFQRQSHFAEAIPVLTAALRLEPDSRQVLFRLGAALEREGQHAAAEMRFRRLLELDPDFAPALNYLGYMWAERGENLSEALDLVSRAVALEPDNGAYADSLGWAYFQLGRFAEARDHLERAARLVPDDAVIFEHLGDLYLAVGELRQARETYERALSLGGENEDQVRRKLSEIAAGQNL